MMIPFFIEVVTLPSRNILILAILIVISWRIILRRARAYARLLETDALKFLRNDGGSMVGELPLYYMMCLLCIASSKQLFILSPTVMHIA